ncbi:MAG: hypothetical protein PHS66_07755 [Candidatus Omnitrophica bacterium]|nr:hypothetical protein [Candidatus Omnitrophota bacterium]
MNKKRIDKTNQLVAITSGSWEAVKSFAKRVPVWGDLVTGLEKYQDSVNEQTRAKLLKCLEDRVDHLTEELKDYFNKAEGQLFCMKIMETALNAEYIDKQEIFVNALLNGCKDNVSEDEKLRFIDLIRHLSRVALNVLSVIYEMYDKHLENKTLSPQIIIRDVVTEVDRKFKYIPELTDSAIRELKNIGLFSSILNWQRFANRISEGRYVENDAFVYTIYTRKFIEFIKQGRKTGNV